MSRRASRTRSGPGTRSISPARSAPARRWPSSSTAPSSAICTALRAAGGEPADVVSLQLFVTDVPGYRAARRELGAGWRKHFGTHFPAMGLFGVTELAEPDALVEVMGVAVLQRG